MLQVGKLSLWVLHPEKFGAMGRISITDMGVWSPHLWLVSVLVGVREGVPPVKFLC